MAAAGRRGRDEPSAGMPRWRSAAGRCPRRARRGRPVVASTRSSTDSSSAASNAERAAGTDVAGPGLSKIDPPVAGLVRRFARADGLSVSTSAGVSACRGWVVIGTPASPRDSAVWMRSESSAPSISPMLVTAASSETPRMRTDASRSPIIACCRSWTRASSRRLCSATSRVTCSVSSARTRRRCSSTWASARARTASAADRAWRVMSSASVRARPTMPSARSRASVVGRSRLGAALARAAARRRCWASSTIASSVGDGSFPRRAGLGQRASISRRARGSPAALGARARACSVVRLHAVPPVLLLRRLPTSRRHPRRPHDA